MIAFTRDQRDALLISAVTALIALVLTAALFSDYARTEEFLGYRLGQNLRGGYGPVYNPGEHTLLTFGPIPALISAADPANARTVAAVVWIASLAIGAGLAFSALRRTEIERRDALAIIVFMTLAWPVWAGCRSESALIFALILAGMVCIQQDRFRLGGFITGLAPLVAASGFIPVIVLGLFALRSERAHRYWLLAIISSLIWVGVVLLAFGAGGFDGLGLRPSVSPAGWQDWLWLALAAAGALAMSRASLPPILWIFPLWAAGAILADVTFHGTLTQIIYPAVGMTIALGISAIAPQIQQSAMAALAASGALALAVLLVAPPQTTPELAAEIELGRALQIPPTASLAHNRGDALAYFIPGFTGDVHRLDGRRDPIIEALRERDDWQSLLVALASDYILLDPTGTLSEIDMDAIGVQALAYEQVNASLPGGNTVLWQREAEITDKLDSVHTVDVAFGPDVTLTAWDASSLRFAPGEVVRLRLDWQFARSPQDTLGINISLLDTSGNAVASIFPVHPASGWPLAVSTYHALQIPANALPGVLRVQITLDYRAGILGRQVITGQLAVSSPAVDLPDAAVGSLGPVTLLRADFALGGTQLVVDLTWRTSQPLDRDYQVFLHLSPRGDLAPVTQADGPVLGGRFPTSAWLPGDTITETRTLMLAELPAGEYQINTGMYTLEGDRLRGETGDLLTIAYVTLGESGEVTVSPAP